MTTNNTNQKIYSKVIYGPQKHFKCLHRIFSTIKNQGLSNNSTWKKRSKYHFWWRVSSKIKLYYSPDLTNSPFICTYKRQACTWKLDFHLEIVKLLWLTYDAKKLRLSADGRSKNPGLFEETGIHTKIGQLPLPPHTAYTLDSDGPASFLLYIWQDQGRKVWNIKNADEFQIHVIAAVR